MKGTEKRMELGDRVPVGNEVDTIRGGQGSKETGVGEVSRSKIVHGRIIHHLGKEKVAGGEENRRGRWCLSDQPRILGLASSIGLGAGVRSEKGGREGKGINCKLTSQRRGLAKPFDERRVFSLLTLGTIASF
ncbi:hypothetical protein ACLOJK_040717 [Asimina triloba]